MIDPSIYRVPPDTPFRMAAHDPDSKEGFSAGKSEGREALPALTRRLAELQTRLWAESKQKLLVVLQAMDTGGKDGTIRHVFGGVNPQGVRVHGFGRPTEVELAHDYLWRVHSRTPGNGEIAVFNRSHYEDVLVVRVEGLVPEERWQRRFDHIRDFERRLADEGTTLVKLYLNISLDEQRERLEARLAEPDKNWKFEIRDLETRAKWDEYMFAYEEAIGRTSTKAAPWYVVPANRKWYRNLAVSSILIATVEQLDPRYPDPEEGLEDIIVK